MRVGSLRQSLIALSMVVLSYRRAQHHSQYRCKRQPRSSCKHVGLASQTGSTCSGAAPLLLPRLAIAATVAAPKRLVRLFAAATRRRFRLVWQLNL